MAESKIGCARPIGTVVGAPENKESTDNRYEQKENSMITAKVGSLAPDFEAPAYFKGKFTEIKLSNLLGRWVVLCFYPGDFTFV